MFELMLKIVQDNLPFIIVVVAMIIIDTITGLTKAFRYNNYQSEKAKKFFSKMLVYLCLIGAFLLIEFLIANIQIEGGSELKSIHITEVLCIAMVLVELSSINENFEVITGKNYISNVVNFVINKLKKITDTFIGKDDKK